ncbi:hypothetical protein SAMN04488072_102216 [Lentibacillus halodurans]|uniref:Uncharacterized protein n=1 Tax=Lentibacillus halodurans TaxID=237679 RepID=A0A1I0W5T5_9BACI|nr:DUF6361 family protein [Lentibacillus halodurans]SFA83707.1 hypothetical protein SAMN04488072_102216 [Lentibacillus halodurans]
MNELKLGWIDYSSEHREKVMAVLDALSAPGAVDELGIGRIRDGFADILFPGTSTIQTRAKYFLIVPYLLMELEKERYARSEDLLEKLGDEEVALIETLNKEGQSGVIGGRAGTNLKRKPSNIYWNGLRTYEIFRHESLSLTNYTKAVFRMKHNKELVNTYGNEELDDAGNKDGAYIGTFWKCILPEPGWKHNLSMDLSYEEAHLLKTRITSAEKSKDSLLSYLLTMDYDNWREIDSFEALDTIIPDKGSLRDNFNQANKFSEFLHGAHIRYNLIASNGQNKTAVKKWTNWINSNFVKYEFATFPFRKVLHRLSIHNSKLTLFLRDWQEAVVSRDEVAMDELIIKREIELKSKDRAKLHNSKMYSYQDGDWIGNDKLQYRFQDAKIIMEDIVAGLEGKYAEAR